jgi:hypothetical protein
MKIFDHKFYESKFGIVVPMAKGILEPHEVAMDESVAMDAMPSLVTQGNSGIPAYLTNYLDPEMLRVLVTPSKAATIFGETKKGDWVTQTAMFPVIESTGEVTSYGDHNEGGMANQNINWVNRQSYLFQTMTVWGELELARAGEAKINYAANLNVSSALILDKFMNNSYFFGVSGLLNFGLLNDPSLPASITPTTGAGGNTWALKTAAEIYADVSAMYVQLQVQLAGLVDRDAKMVLALSPTSEAQLTKTNIYNVNVLDQIKKNFPNLRIETAIQYATGAGNLVQMICEQVDGQDTGYCAFNEKMRAHAVVVQSSSFKQKKTSGTWGSIIRMPVAIASMLGV